MTSKLSSFSDVAKAYQRSVNGTASGRIQDHIERFYDLGTVLDELAGAVHLPSEVEEDDE